MRIMPVDRVDCSWGVIDSNDFDLFTRCVRKLFRKERFHWLGMSCVYSSVEKIMHQRANLIPFFFPREMARVEKMELCVGKLSFIELSALDFKDSVILAPRDQHRRLLFAKIFLPIGIGI